MTPLSPSNHQTKKNAQEHDSNIWDPMPSNFITNILKVTIQQISFFFSSTRCSTYRTCIHDSRFFSSFNSFFDMDRTDSIKTEKNARLSGNRKKMCSKINTYSNIIKDSRLHFLAIYLRLTHPSALQGGLCILIVFDITQTFRGKKKHTEQTNYMLSTSV